MFAAYLICVCSGIILLAVCLVAALAATEGK